jgi:hypothetical protein
MVRQEDREDFGQWAMRLIQRGNDTGILTYQNLLYAIDLAVKLYYISKEKKLKPYGADPRPESSSNPNEERQEFYEKQGVPP